MVPIPWQQFSNPALRHICDASEHVGQPCLWIDVIELGRHDQCCHCRCSVGAAFGAGEQPRLSTECKSSKRTFGRVVREADPAIFDESGKPVPTLEHVIDRLGDRGRARQARVLLTQPRFKSGQNGRTLFMAYAEALFGAQAVDVALDIEQRVNALNRLQRNRRDRRCVLSAPCIGSDIGQLEELSPCVCPAQCGRNRSLRARGIVELVVPAIGVGLQDALEDAARDARAFVLSCFRSREA